MVVVVVEILASKVTFVTVNEVYLISFIRGCRIDWWHFVWLLYSSQPGFASHKLVAKLGWFNIELIVAVKLVVRAFDCCFSRDVLTLKLVMFLGRG